MCLTSKYLCTDDTRVPTCVLQAAAPPQEEAAPAAPAAEREAIAEPAEPRAGTVSAAHAPPGEDHAAAIRDSAPAAESGKGGEEEEELDLPSAPTTRLEPMEQLRAAAAQRGRALAVEEPLPA